MYFVSLVDLRLITLNTHLTWSLRPVGESTRNRRGNDVDLCGRLYIRTVHTPRPVFTRKSIVFPGKVTISTYRFSATGYYRTVRQQRSRSVLRSETERRRTYHFMRFQENVIPETPRVTPASITFYAVIRRGLLRKLLSVRFATIYSVATSTVVPWFKGVAVFQDQRIDVIDARLFVECSKINCFHWKSDYR